MEILDHMANTFFPDLLIFAKIVEKEILEMTEFLRVYHEPLQSSATEAQSVWQAAQLSKLII